MLVCNKIISYSRLLLLFDNQIHSLYLYIFLFFLFKLDNEKTKYGLSLEELPELALFVSQLPQLKLRGLMALPIPLAKEEEQYESFCRFTSLFKEVNKKMNLEMDILSMGMSADFIAAIRAGATMLRLGQAIFGKRDYIRKI